jgi:hypothetical protein
MSSRDTVREPHAALVYIYMYVYALTRMYSCACSYAYLLMRGETVRYAARAAAQSAAPRVARACAHLRLARRYRVEMLAQHREPLVEPHGGRLPGALRRRRVTAPPTPGRCASRPSPRARLAPSSIVVVPHCVDARRAPRRVPARARGAGRISVRRAAATRPRARCAACRRLLGRAARIGAPPRVALERSSATRLGEVENARAEWRGCWGARWRGWIGGR